MSPERLEAITGEVPNIVASETLPDSSEQAFEALPRRTQISRLRRLAESALADYDLPPHRLSLLVHLYNTTFRVDTETGQRYVLHIDRSGPTTADAAGSELAWVSALRRDTTLEVPDPVPTRSGQLLTVAKTPEVPSAHFCVLFRWLYGRRVTHNLTPKHLALTGELMARLHLHATQWTLPPGFTRGRVDYPVDRACWLPDPFAPEIVTYCRDLVSDTLSPAEAGPVVDTLERVREAEAILVRDAAAGQPTFGLIHADLHYYNLLFARNTVKAIDFHDCGFGPHLYDHAVMLSELLDRPTYRPLRDALLSGYRRVRHLAPEHEALLDTLIALRTIQDALWVLETRVHPALGEDWAAEARQTLARLPDLLSSSAGE